MREAAAAGVAPYGVPPLIAHRLPCQSLDLTL